MKILQIGFASPPPTHYSNIFKTWIRVLIKTVGKLEVWFLKESVMETCRKDFKTVGQGKLR